VTHVAWGRGGAACAVVVAVASASACARGPRGPDIATTALASPSPPRPASCRALTSAEPLQAAIDESRPGTALCLEPGTYPGPIRVDHGVVLWGPRDAVVASSGQGTTVDLRGAGTQLLGLTVRGSGHRFDTTDAAVKVSFSEDARVEGVRVVGATFGIIVERSKRVTVRSNEVVGSGDLSLGMRGDGIRFWETEDSILQDNDVHDSRDVVVWYSPRNHIEGNRVTRSRYGTHLMFSRDTVVVRNRYVGNEVGVFVMYTRDVRVEDNLMAGATGAAGMGLGLKESGNVVARGNRIIQDSVGVYVDTSPLQPDDVDVLAQNVFRLDQTAIVFHAPPRGTRIVSNSFRDNAAQVRVDGEGDALGIEWEGNDWDDYRGYDLNGDGTGDVPYELRSLSGELTARHPQLDLFAGSPVLAIIEAAGHVFPLLEPRTLLRDPRPRMRATSLEYADAN
jgi:nitrous oxidase accessory protein